VDSDRIYFRAASQTDANAIQVLAKAFGCSQSQIVRFAMAEWLSDNFVKRLEFAQALQEVKEAQDDSRQT
tara:strand:- start:22 stop:231 length:210 start_codon:yes stop_codon:yes gene_type:complete